MDRQRVVALLAVGILVVGLGVAAGALDSQERDQGGEGSGTTAGAGVEGSDGEQRRDREITTDTIASIPPVVQLLLAVLVAILLVFSAVDIVRRHGPKAVATVIGVFVLVALILQSMGEGGAPNLGEGGNQTNISVGGEAGGIVSTGETVSQTTEPPVILGGIIAFVALGGLLLYLLSGRSSETSVPSTESVAVKDDAEAIAQTAGEAADRVASGVGVENEIYRAWEEMTAELEMDRPESTTPAEFADAAVAAGFDREDVAELTRLFEETRYGEYPVTADRADRAERALRSVEQYGGGE